MWSPSVVVQTVGRPLGLLLTRRSNAFTVTRSHTGTRDPPALDPADITAAVSGTCRTADMWCARAPVSTSGVSRTDDGTGRRRIPVWELAGHVSPNPGGKIR